MTLLIYIPLIVMVIVYSLMILKINSFIKSLQKSANQQQQQVLLNGTLSLVDSENNNYILRNKCVSMATSGDTYSKRSSANDQYRYYNNKSHYLKENPFKMKLNQNQIKLNKQITAHKHSRSILITLFVYCLITILFWLPLQSKISKLILKKNIN